MSDHRPMYSPMKASTRPRATYVFERPEYRVWVDLLGSGTGSLAFLAFAALLLTGRVSFGGGLIFNILPAMVFGFFGVFMGLGFLAAVRRGMTRAILEIGPAGMWTPEMGFLTWSDVAEVRLERVRGPSGDAVADYAKIGIVPRDPARTERVHRSLAYRMYAAFASFVRRAAPSAGMQDADSLAPFGIFGYELESSIGSVVDAIREFHPIRMPDGSLAEVLSPAPQ